jgi:prepilin-type N-terminal cleavage/methylation domain-containing protein
MEPLVVTGKTEILIVGSLNKFKKIAGFTLIELIVVLSIIGTLAMFSLPLFSNLNLFSDSTGDTGDIVRLINDLKKRAVEHNSEFILHIDTGSGMIWVTNDAMDEEEISSAQEKGVPFAENLTVIGVDFPNSRATEELKYQIRFRKQGYSDFAIIHITRTHLAKGDKKISLKIEPFLSQIQFIDGHIYFDDCI